MTISDIPKTDKLFLILHRAGLSIGDTAFVGKEGISWLVFGSKGDHSIQANGKTQEVAWKQACRETEEMGLVQPLKEYVYRERPSCRIIWDFERHWIDVEGTSGIAEVRRYLGRRWAGPGAYRPPRCGLRA